MNGDTELNSRANTIQAYEIQDRIKYLEDFEEDDELEDYEIDELNELRALAEEIGWQALDDGVMLINECYVAEYAEEFAEDIGAVDTDNFNWPYYWIDWDKAGEALMMDHTSVEFEGVTFYYQY